MSARPICRSCGHEKAFHNVGGCGYGASGLFGGCGCTTFVGPKKRQRRAVPRPADLTDELTLAMRKPHGTRTRYVLGCRCDECRAANTRAYHERRQRRLAEAARPCANGPPLDGVLVRAGVTYRVKRCPGANGSPCVADNAWLRNGGSICTLCIERHTVWNGVVDAARARRHLERLARAGVGRRLIADVAGVGQSSLQEIKKGRKRRIRAAVERRILAVDATKDGRPRTDVELVDAAPTRKRIAWLLKMGFTRQELARKLGATSKTPSLQIAKCALVTAKTAARVERLYRSFAA